MSVDRRLLVWGVFLVLLGLVPLAVTQGWVPRDVVARAWEMWPFALIGAGIGLVLGGTPFRAVGGLVVAATLGIMLGALVSAGFGGVNLGSIGCGAAEPGAPTVLERDGSFSGPTASVRLEANCAAVAVGMRAGPAWAVDVRGSSGSRPTLEETADGLVVRSPGGAVVFPFETRRSSWDVRLPTEPRLDLDLVLNAGSATVDLAHGRVGRLHFGGNAVGDSRLDLGSATVERLEVEVNASDLVILLPAGADLAGTVQGNAASVRLCAPDGAGLRLAVDDNVTAANNYEELGLAKVGGAWETPGFANAATRIELRTTGSAVSFMLQPGGDCR